MKPEEIEQMKADMEAGTPPDGWSTDEGGEVHRYGSTIFAWPEYSDQSDPGKIHADMSRGARVPAMEAEILRLREALSEVLEALDDGLCNEVIPGFDAYRLDRACVSARAVLNGEAP
jgi:hypothetical protein